MGCNLTNSNTLALLLFSRTSHGISVFVSAEGFSIAEVKGGMHMEFKARFNSPYIFLLITNTVFLRVGTNPRVSLNSNECHIALPNNLKPTSFLDGVLCCVRPSETRLSQVSYLALWLVGRLCDCIGFFYPGLLQFLGFLFQNFEVII